MRVTILPFFSQQNKQTNKFLLRSCGSTKMCSFLANKIVDELGISTTLVLPLAEDCEDPQLAQDNGYWILRTRIPPENIAQRLHWDPVAWRRLFTDTTLLINCHELLGWPLKHVFPAMKVIQMNVLTPDEPWPWMAPLFFENWKTVDQLVCLSDAMQEYLENAVNKLEHTTPVRPWRLSFDEQALETEEQERDIDILFVLRGSSTNYSHHLEFIETLRYMQGHGYTGKVAFPDVTRYLRATGSLEMLDNVETLADPSDQVAYAKMLRRSKLVIGMNANQHGGMSIREAIHCGAVPVVLRVPGYEELVGPTWPFYIEDSTPGAILQVLEQATAVPNPWTRVSAAERSALERNVARESFQGAWDEQIKGDIKRMLKLQ